VQPQIDKPIRKPALRIIQSGNQHYKLSKVLNNCSQDPSPTAILAALIPNFQQYQELHPNRYHQLKPLLQACSFSKQKRNSIPAMSFLRLISSYHTIKHPQSSIHTGPAQ